MRFIGNKESIVDDITDFLIEAGLLEDNIKNKQMNFFDTPKVNLNEEKLETPKKKLVFFDAFTGTGSVSEAVKDKYDIITNDLLRWCTIYTEGRLHRNNCRFEKLEFDPIKYLNDNKEIIKGFFYNNYTPVNSGRMYFSEFNGGRIDFFRQTIENWYKDNLITDKEYKYLIACLLESVSLVANVAGVYGSFLKHWDKRALNDIRFVEVEGFNNNNPNTHISLNSRIEDIIEKIDCDILYLDPPYTQNQYGTQYHLLETLVLYDDPSISKVTGSRRTAPMRSDWSKNFMSHILFDYIVSNTKADHIILSYNIDGFMSKQYIEAVLKRYGKAETYMFREIDYKKYRNWKTNRDNKHYEYLFYIEKKDENEIIYESPLNYIGSKYKYIDQIKKHMPSDINTFFDLFGGGLNVGINIDAEKIIYNDINWIVKELIESFYELDTYDYLMYIKRIENKYGLEANNKEAYIEARQDYNKSKHRDSRFLYTLILYGFQQQIRFNNRLEFNNPVGMRWFNDNILEKLISFSRKIKTLDIAFISKDYRDFIGEINRNDFVYLDPPYRKTNGSYNDGRRGFNGWDLEQENQLFDFIDSLDYKGIRFMLSYILEHNGEKNYNILKWLDRGNYKLIELDRVPGRNRDEVIIINYG